MQGDKAFEPSKNAQSLEKSSEERKRVRTEKEFLRNYPATCISLEQKARYLHLGYFPGTCSSLTLISLSPLLSSGGFASLTPGDGGGESVIPVIVVAGVAVPDMWGSKCSVVG